MEYKECKDGIIIMVKVIPKASRSEIVGWENEFLKIRIAAVPDKGKANNELILFMSKVLDVNRSGIKILSGEASRLKRVFLGGVTPDRLKVICSSSDFEV